MLILRISQVIPGCVFWHYLFGVAPVAKWMLLIFGTFLSFVVLGKAKLRHFKHRNLYASPAASVRSSRQGAGRHSQSLAQGPPIRSIRHVLSLHEPHAGALAGLEVLATKKRTPWPWMHSLRIKMGKVTLITSVKHVCQNICLKLHNVLWYYVNMLLKPVYNKICLHDCRGQGLIAMVFAIYNYCCVSCNMVWCFPKCWLVHYPFFGL